MVLCDPERLPVIRNQQEEVSDLLALVREIEIEREDVFDEDVVFDPACLFLNPLSLTGE